MSELVVNGPVYRTEQYVGKAIREEGLERKQLFVTTKYDGGRVQQAAKDSLSKVSFVYDVLVHDQPDCCSLA